MIPLKVVCFLTKTCFVDDETKMMLNVLDFDDKSGGSVRSPLFLSEMNVQTLKEKSDQREKDYYCD